MIKSMTSFGRFKDSVGGKDITVELKSVNNRFFECSVKISRRFSFLEEKVKPFLRDLGIQRGKVDVLITVEQTSSEDGVISIDTAYAENYITALRTLKDTFGLKDDISVMTVAQNKDIFTLRTPEGDPDADWRDISSVLGKAGDAFLTARIKEGERIALDISEKMRGIASRVDRIEALSENAVSTYKTRLEEKLRETLSDNHVTLDESRILTECAIYADRVAIDEELVRLRSHIVAFGDYLKSNEPVGRSLDFLLQEMNREINTTGSKCNDSEIAHLVVEVKNELEKVREQIQNIE